MLLLVSTSDKLRLITSAALNLDVHATFVDMASGLITPDRKNTLITTATTTDIVAAPAASTFRTVKALTIRNRHATTQNDVTLIHTDGTNAVELVKVTLPAQYTLHYHEGAGFWVTDNRGANVAMNLISGIGPAVNALNLVTLGADVTNNNAVANTIADVTGLSFAVINGQTYWFRFAILFTAAATTTGSRWSINGPGSPTILFHRINYSLTSSTETGPSLSGIYDSGAVNASSFATAGNMAIIEGFITPSADGTVIARFSSEVASSAIVAKAGSMLQYVRTL